MMVNMERNYKKSSYRRIQFGIILLWITGIFGLLIPGFAESTNKTILRIAATGLKNPLAYESNVKIFQITVNDNIAIPLDQVPLSKGWELRNHPVSGEAYLTNNSRPVDPLEIPVVGDFVRVRFQKHSKGGFVFIQSDQDSQLIDLYSPNLGGEWQDVTLRLRPQEALARWEKAHQATYERSLFRDKGAVKSLDGKQLWAWSVSDYYRLDPWPALPLYKARVASRVSLNQVRIPAQAQFSMGLKWNPKSDSPKVLKIEGVFYPDFSSEKFKAPFIEVEGKNEVQRIQGKFENTEEMQGRLTLTFTLASPNPSPEEQFDIIDPVISGLYQVAPARKNIILFTLDTTRADHLTIYGYHRDTTPFLKEMESQMIIYDNAYAQAPSTVPSHFSLFTSRYCKDTGVYSNIRKPLKEEEITLAEVLQEAGWTTGAVVSVRPIGSTSGLAQGFDEFYDPLFTDISQRGEEATRNAKEFIRNHADEPFFLWIHYFDAHLPYQPEPEYRSLFWKGEIPKEENVDRSLISSAMIDRLSIVPHLEYMIAMYDASLRYQDDQVRDVFDYLQKLNLMDDTIVVLTADHGESLGEHGIYFAHAGLYDVTIRVPMMIYAPGISHPGRREAKVVENVDIAPTLLNLVGLKSPSRFRGQPLLGSQPLDDMAFFEHLGPGYRKGEVKFIDERIRKAREDFKESYLKIWWQEPEFLSFNLKQDPKELKNLATDHQELIQEHLKVLSEWSGKDLGLESQQAIPTPEPELPLDEIDPKLLESLRSLGYVQ